MLSHSQNDPKVEFQSSWKPTRIFFSKFSPTFFFGVDRHVAEMWTWSAGCKHELDQLALCQNAGYLRSWSFPGVDILWLSYGWHIFKLSACKVAQFWWFSRWKYTDFWDLPSTVTWSGEMAGSYPDIPSLASPAMELAVLPIVKLASMNNLQPRTSMIHPYLMNNLTNLGELVRLWKPLEKQRRNNG